MTKRTIGGAVVASIMAATSQAAFANTWNVTCSGSTSLALNGGSAVSFGSDPGGLTGSGNASGAPDALGALLGTPSQNTESALATDFGTTLASGDIVEISGVCQQDAEIRIPGITLTNPSWTGPSSPPSLSTSDGIEGQLQIMAAGGGLIAGLLLGNASSTFTFAHTADQANLLLQGAASATITNSQVSYGPFIGVLATGGSTVYALNTTVSYNGSGSGASSAAPSTNDGIQARDTSTIYLGQPGSGNSATLAYNAGNGATAQRASSLVVQNATISNNGHYQVYINQSSSAFITSVNATTTISAAGESYPAIDVSGTSTLTLENGVSVRGNADGAAVYLQNASGAMLQDSFLDFGSVSSAAQATVQADGMSVVTLLGGNNICGGDLSAGSCTALSTAEAIELLHESALIQGAPGMFNYPQQADTINGGGVAEIASSFDLGVGLVGSAQSLTWTTGSEDIDMSQHSILRLEGGVTITGTVYLSQGSEGYFNHANGGTNNITTLDCPWSNLPDARVVVSGSSLSPAPTLADSFSSAAADQCLSF